MKVEMYQCPICKKLHTKEDVAIKCEQKCLVKKAEIDAEQVWKSKIEEILNYPRLNAKSISHLEVLLKSAAKDVWNIDLDVKIKVSFTETASNSHHAPIGKKTNWTREKDIPTSYPAFVGSISGTVKYEKSKFKKEKSDSDFFSSSFRSGIKGVCTGTGSGNGNSDGNFRYDVTLFSDDFPYLKHNMDLIQEKKRELREYTKLTNSETESKINEDVQLKDMSDDIDDIEDKIEKLQRSMNEMKNERMKIAIKKYYNPAKDLIAIKQQEVNEYISKLEEF